MVRKKKITTNQLLYMNISNDRTLAFYIFRFIENVYHRDIADNADQRVKCVCDKVSIEIMYTRKGEIWMWLGKINSKI